MANKLKDIFSKKPLERKVKFDFYDEKGYSNFIKGLQELGKTGMPVEVSGVKGVKETIGNGDANYSEKYETNIVKSMLYPAQKPIDIKLTTKSGERIVTLNRIKVDTGYLILAEIGQTIKFNLKSDLEKQETKFSYDIKQKRAKNLHELILDYETAVAFCRYLFKNEDQMKKIESDSNRSEINNIKGVIDFFDRSLTIFEHLEYICTKFKLDVSPVDFGENNNYSDVEELYYSTKGIPLRSVESFGSLKTNAKDLDLTKKNELIGTAVNLTFVSNVTYDIFGNDVTLYSANLLCNAVIGEIDEQGDKVEVTLQPEKDKSMYISYTAYTTAEEAKDGLQNIMNDRGKYFNAPTINQFIMETMEGDSLKAIGDSNAIK